MEVRIADIGDELECGQSGLEWARSSLRWELLRFRRHHTAAPALSPLGVTAIYSPSSLARPRTRHTPKSSAPSSSSFTATGRRSASISRPAPTERHARLHHRLGQQRRPHRGHELRHDDRRPARPQTRVRRAVELVQDLHAGDGPEEPFGRLFRLVVKHGRNAALNRRRSGRRGILCDGAAFRGASLGQRRRHLQLPGRGGENPARHAPSSVAHRHSAVPDSSRRPALRPARQALAKPKQSPGSRRGCRPGQAVAAGDPLQSQPPPRDGRADGRRSLEHDPLRARDEHPWHRRLVSPARRSTSCGRAGVRRRTAPFGPGRRTSAANSFER